MAASPPFLHWVETSPSGILIQEGSPKVMHSGRVIDLLYLGNDSLLVGTETGGVWKFRYAVLQLVMWSDLPL